MCTVSILGYACTNPTEKKVEVDVQETMAMWGRKAECHEWVNKEKIVRTWHEI